MVSEELGGADAVLVDCISDPPENIVQIRRLMLLIGSICYSIEVYTYPFTLNFTAQKGVIATVL